jgi:hypothetical protein
VFEILFGSPTKVMGGFGANVRIVSSALFIAL